jgi:hypothetical protein
MTPESIVSRRLVGLFLLGFILFNYPILSLFNLRIYWFGMPLLYLYVFVLWGVFILIIVLISRYRETQSRPPKIASHR